MAIDVRFWGTRGSFPAMGPDFARYGGDTSCVSVSCAQRLFVFDAGSGSPRNIGKMGFVHGRIEAIQLYTVARPTPEPEARPLRAAQMDDLARQVRAALPELPVEVFYGPE